MNKTTTLLNAAANGDPKAAEELLPLVYDQLRRLAAHKMASERAGHTLTATALVHEAYMRLVGTENGQHWDGRGHFFAAAAEAMRRILIDRAREKKSLKRGGDLQRQELPDIATDEQSLSEEDLEQLEQQRPRVVRHLAQLAADRTGADVETVGRAIAATAPVALGALERALEPNDLSDWIATLPAIFMTTVVISFLAYSEIGFRMPIESATVVGIVAAVICVALFFWRIKVQPASAVETTPQQENK